MTIKNETIASPTAIISGDRVTVNTNNEIWVDKNYSGGLVYSVIIQKNGKRIKHASLEIFQNKATVTLRTQYGTRNLPTRGRFTAHSNVNTGDKGGTSNIVIGTDPYGKDERYAEIYYTLNGKDPKRTKNNFYKGVPLVFYNNNSADKIILKARVYKEGTWSAVSRFEFKIIGKSGEDTQFQSNILENELLATLNLRRSKV